MKRQQWLENQDPVKMLNAIQFWNPVDIEQAMTTSSKPLEIKIRNANRKLRLFAHAIYTLSKPLAWMPHPEWDYIGEEGEAPPNSDPNCLANRAWDLAIRWGSQAEWRAVPTQAVKADLLRDIFDYTFQPQQLCGILQSGDQKQGPLRFIHPDLERWLRSGDGAVAKLAQVIYADRDFDKLPMLADALMEAGCEHQGIMEHCTTPNLRHVRGCWVLDLLLGKE
jgi:hypothetical protein